MSTTEEKHATKKHCHGRWIADLKNDAREVFRLELTSGSCNLEYSNRVSQGWKVHFDGSCDRVGNFLVFKDGLEYYIKSATERHLVFGKFKQAGEYGESELEWEYTFERI